VYFEVQCGDGEIGPGEECDDGNSEDGDCCSATCLYEDPGTECGDGNACTGADVCDGAGVCAAGGPSSTCIGGFAKATLLINEKRAGKEKVIAKLNKGPDIALADFGFQAPPLVMPTTMYSLCIFDDADNLIVELEARRLVVSECAGKQCWSQRGLGWLYKDKAAAYDGVQQIKLKGGPAGKTQVQVKAGNNEPKGQVALPTGIAAQLTTTTNAKVQVVSTDAACFEAVVDQVKKQDTYLFKAIKK
jgi:cysteine-rich repeat protein